MGTYHRALWPKPKQNMNMKPRPPPLPLKLYLPPKAASESHTAGMREQGSCAVPIWATLGFLRGLCHHSPPQLARGRGSKSALMRSPFWGILFRTTGPGPGLYFIEKTQQRNKIWVMGGSESEPLRPSLKALVNKEENVGHASARPT
jgi:hypothetical protein